MSREDLVKKLVNRTIHANRPGVCLFVPACFFPAGQKVQNANQRRPATMSKS